MKYIFKFCPLCKHRLHKAKVDGRNRLICKECGWIYYENPLPVTVCVVKNKEGKILIAKRNLSPGKNKWALPGGFVESGETSEFACLRELKEETGLKGRIKRLIGVYTQDIRLYGSLLVIGYEISVSKYNLSLNSELKEAKFVDREALPYIPFLTHRKIIDKVYENSQ